MYTSVYIQVLGYLDISMGLVKMFQPLMLPVFVSSLLPATHGLRPGLQVPEAMVGQALLGCPLQLKKSGQGRILEQKLAQRPWKGVAYWLASYDLLSIPILIEPSTSSSDTS